MLLPHIGRTGPSSYCTTVNVGLDAEYAITLDYDGDLLCQLLILLPREVTNRIYRSLTAPFTGPVVVELEQPFYAMVTARVGPPIHEEQEVYAPLQVLLMAPAAADDNSFTIDPPDDSEEPPLPAPGGVRQ
jgi:hypothetical protein